MSLLHYINLYAVKITEELRIFKINKIFIEPHKEKSLKLSIGQLISLWR